MESFKCDVFGDFQTLCLKVVMNVPVKISWRVKSASPFVELGNDFPPLAPHSNDFVLKTLPQGRPSNENRHFLIDMSQLNTILKYRLCTETLTSPVKTREAMIDLQFLKFKALSKTSHFCQTDEGFRFRKYI